MSERDFDREIEELEDEADETIGRMRTVAQKLMEKGMLDHDPILEQMELDRKLLMQLKAGEITPAQAEKMVEKNLEKRMIDAGKTPDDPAFLFLPMLVQQWRDMLRDFGIDEFIRINNETREQYMRGLN